MNGGSEEAEELMYVLKSDAMMSIPRPEETAVCGRLLTA
jgi:hypothetical protein